MNAGLSTVIGSADRPDVARTAESSGTMMTWMALPGSAQAYVAAVVVAGAFLIVRFFPTTIPHPVVLAALIAAACITSSWKVTLPLSDRNGSTLSVSYAADLIALLLLGPEQAMIVAVAGAWTQCTINARHRYPLYRTVFSMAAEAITIQAVGLTYVALGDGHGLQHLAALPRPLVGAIATYFVVNTGLVALAIALSTRQNAWRIWHENFLWSCPSFMVAGAAGAMAAVVFDRGSQWLAILMLAPIYLTYRTYHVFLGRIEDQRRHVEETEKLHSETLDALLQAKRAEQALAEEKERLAVTLRSIGDGVITTDLNGTVLLINNVAESLTGWTQSEAAGRPLTEVFRNFDPDTRELCDNSTAMIVGRASQPNLSRCTVLVARNLTEHPVEEICAPLRDASGMTMGMVVAFRDITDVIKMQQERAKANTVASLGLLAGGMAHDFNDVLMAIMGNVSMARVTTRVEPTIRALDEAQQACVRARQLIWQLLTFSRGGMPMKKTMLVSGLLRDCAAFAVRGSKVQCIFDIPQDLWEISADEDQIVQLLNNVIVNAQQAMAHGGMIEIHAENVVEPVKRWENTLPVEPGRYVKVSIADHGVGIPEENLSRIFDPYFSTKQNCSGLGLATAYSIIKNHGGYVTAESTSGVGTTLTVCLPALNGSDMVLEPAVPAVIGRTNWSVH